MADSLAGCKMTEDLARQLATLRDMRPDLLTAISCFALFVKGARVPDMRLSAFGVDSATRFEGMVAVVEAELEVLRRSSPRN